MSNYVLQLQDQVEELENELRQLRSQELDSNVRTALEEQIQQLAQQGGEHHVALVQIQPDSDQPSGLSRLIL